MATFSIDIDKDRGFSFITVEGEIAPGEISRFRDNIHHELRTPLVLWSMTEASWRRIPSDNLFAEAEDAKRFDAKGNRTALVCSEGVEYGIGRMIEYYTEAQNFAGEFRLFKDVEAAKEWLFSDTNPGFENLEQQ